MTTLMPEYICHKHVRALKITEIINGTLIPEDGAFSVIFKAPAWHEKHDPAAPCYYIVQEDGYTSWSPVEAFESGYSPVLTDCVEETEPEGPISGGGSYTGPGDKVP